MTDTATAPAQITTVNPATGAELARYDVHDRAAVGALLDAAVAAQRAWREVPLAERAARVRGVAAVLRARASELGELASREMGKPLIEAEAEVEKCAWCCEHYAEHAEAYVGDEPAPSGATESYVAYRPLGVLLAIMPWNFPYWQVVRAAAPALVAGNVIALKHAANVTGCAYALERAFVDAGLPAGLFTTLVVPGREMDAVVADRRVACVTLTGSEAAGSAVAATAGGALKKTVLELGGSDAFIVLADADIDAAAAVGVKARFQNSGQSCIAAKRFIVEAPVYDAFLAAFERETAKLVVGDPLDRATTVGPLARADLRGELAAQVDATVAAGARLVTGGGALPGDGAYFAPTIVEGVEPGMTLFDEETFGPVAAIVRARDADHAVELANASAYGLGGNLWTRDVSRAKAIAARLESGGVFINGMTSSDPRLPFGGVKRSGYGRELSSFGIREFVNVQTVWIGPSTEAHRSAVAVD